MSLRACQLACRPSAGGRVGRGCAGGTSAALGALPHLCCAGCLWGRLPHLGMGIRGVRFWSIVKAGERESCWAAVRREACLEEREDPRVGIPLLCRRPCWSRPKGRPAPRWLWGHPSVGA